MLRMEAVKLEKAVAWIAVPHLIRQVGCAQRLWRSRQRTAKSAAAELP